MIRALHTKTYIIGAGNKKSAVKASAYRSGKSVVAAAAYRANDKIKSETDGRTHDYTRKRGVILSQILLPEGAPERFNDRSTLWNEVERVELAVRKDAQFARQWEASFPPEFSREDQKRMLIDFARDYFVSHGMIADVALHDKGEGNPHAHFLLTLRFVNEKGFGGKGRVWNSYKFAQLWRTAWAERCNEIYKKMDLPTRIDPRSYKIQGNGLEPTKPIGKAANQLEKRGIKTTAGDRNRAIMARNKDFMRTILYDIMQPSPEEKTEPVENNRSERNDPELNAKRSLEANKTRKAIRQLSAEIDDLREFETLISGIEKKIVAAKEAGNKKAVSQLEQSLKEATTALEREYFTGQSTVEFEGLLADHISVKSEELQNYEFYLEELLEDKKVHDNVVPFKADRDRQSDIESEIEREEGREKTKER
jgi:ATP-dependent exoDNAse (exonuclease V) alpha subunit